jgi:hypothetical protein
MQPAEQAQEGASLPDRLRGKLQVLTRHRVDPRITGGPNAPHLPGAIVA